MLCEYRGGEPVIDGKITVVADTAADGAGAATISYTAGHTINEVIIAPVDASGRIPAPVDLALGSC